MEVLRETSIENRFPVAIAAESHPFPFRTRKLSPPAPMVLGGRPPGRVGRRRISPERAPVSGALSRDGYDPDMPPRPRRSSSPPPRRSSAPPRREGAGPKSWGSVARRGAGNVRDGGPPQKASK